MNYTVATCYIVANLSMPMFALAESCIRYLQMMVMSHHCSIIVIISWAMSPGIARRQWH